LVNGLARLVTLVTPARHVFLELRVLLVLAVDLGLQVFNDAVDVADGTLGFAALVFLLFELGFKLVMMS
ncbi:hypothetical protein OFM35_32785, partial [Escherichia coli]|nr:hypothetical protein [Escherichia coli]